MDDYLEKRVCHRFQIPGAISKYKKIGFFDFCNGFKNALSLLDISKGGLSFLCSDSFKRGQPLMIELFSPEETPLHLRSQIRKAVELDHGINLVSVKFMPFGRRRNGNPLEALQTLRKLNDKYCTEYNKEYADDDREEPINQCCNF